MTRCHWRGAGVSLNCCRHSNWPKMNSNSKAFSCVPPQGYWTLGCVALTQRLESCTSSQILDCKMHEQRWRRISRWLTRWSCSSQAGSLWLIAFWRPKSVKSLRSCRRTQVQRWTVFRRSCRSPYQTQTHHLHRTATKLQQKPSCKTCQSCWAVATNQIVLPPPTLCQSMMLLKSVLKSVRHAALVIGFDLRIWRDQRYSGEWLQKITRKLCNCLTW